MSENNEQGFSFEEVSGSDWWIRQISELANWRPGGVFLICTGPLRSIAPTGAWFYTAAGLYTKEREALFPDILLVVPPGTNQLNYRDRIKDAVTHSFEKSGKETPQQISRYLVDQDWPWVQSDADKVLERLERLPEGSAVSIAGAERLRFPKVARPVGPLVLTHTGYRISHSSGDELMLPHLHELLRRLLKLAAERRLSIVVFAENFDFEMEKLSGDLRSHQDLAVSSVRYDDVERSRFRSVVEALKISRTEGLEAAIRYIHQNIPDVAHQAHAISFIYGDQGLWTVAWKTVEGHVGELRALNETSVLLNLAQTAASCGEAKSADELLRHAVSLGFETVESFNAAAIVAKSISDTQLLDQILAEMRTAYPQHAMTLARSYGHLMAKGQYREAAGMADAVGATFEAAWARLRDQGAPDWDAFFKIGCATNREQDALVKCVVHALEIGQSREARAFLTKIPETKETAALRAELLFDIVIKEIGFVETDTDFEQLRIECSSVFAYLAANPADSGLRSSVSRWFESSAEEGSRIVLLLNALTNAYQRTVTQFEPANATNEKEPWSFANAEENCEKAATFMQAVAKASVACPFGRAIAPSEYSTGVSDQVMQGLGVFVHAFTADPDLNGIGNALQCLNLACRIRHEASWDFEAAIQLLAALTVHGKISDGLNLAENILVFWGDNSGEFGPARRAHAWSCVAEVYHRSRNPLTALLYLILCFESMAAQPAHQHSTLLKHKLRLATRILRDLRFTELVSDFLVVEAKLIQAFPRDREEQEWNVTEIGCRLRLINEATPQKDVEDLVASLQTLLEDEKETEWEPPVSVAISGLSILHHYGFSGVDRLVKLIERRLPHCSHNSQKLFRHVSLERPTFGEVQAAIQDLIQGNVYDDQGYGFSAVEGLLRRAMSVACDKKDPELFALAATWLSQPALSASRSSRELFFPQPETQLTSLPELLTAERNLSVQQLRDYASALQRQMDRTQSNFTTLQDLPLAAIGYVAAPDEALCFLAHDAGDNLCRLVVRRGGVEEPSRLTKSQWDATRHSEWLKKFPRGYSWNQLFGYDIPPENDIRNSLEGLQPQVPTNVAAVTIIPESDLFGFTYFLTDAPHGWVGQATTCVTAPSITWLATVRRLENPRLTLKAWLGHPTRADKGVLEPRSELEPVILKAAGTLIDSDSPRSIGTAGVSVILSHGSEGTFGSFIGINDVGQFTNEDLAKWLGQSACVILFVCNAGRNDQRILNQETVGLIGQLLRRGVRAVFAPPAPLRNDLPSLWFTPFIESLRQGKNVGRAHADASAEVRKKFSHPCAWGAIQLFGDAQLKFVTDSK